MSKESVPEKITKKAAWFLETARGMVITTDAEAGQAKAFLDGVQSLIKDEIQAFFKPHKTRVDELKKGLLESERVALAEPLEAEKLTKKALLDFNRKREAEIRAEREAEAKKARAAAEREAELLAAEERLDEREAEEAKEIAVQAAEAALVVDSAPPKVAGVSIAKSYKVSREKVNILKLAAYVVEHPEFLNLLDVNFKSANALARSQQDHFSIPGLELVTTETVRNRRS